MNDSCYNKGGRTKIEIFTYQDYLEYQEFIQKRKLYQTKKKSPSKINDSNVSENIEDENSVHEEEEQYSYNVKKQVNHEHDKIFRKILDDKTEVAKFINKTLKLSYQIKAEELEKYSSSFITTNLQNQEADIIYKLKTRNIFFLIEHQTKIDYSMPFRILEYENAIIKSAIDVTKLGTKTYKLPMVISIVLYSGRIKWNAKKYIKEAQEELEGYKETKFAKYNVVDVNDFSEQELLQEESFLSKAMLIEKTRYTTNLVEYLEKIIKEVNAKQKVYSNEQKELLAVIIEIVLGKKLTKETVEQLVKKLRKEGKEMLAVLEMIDEENKRIFAQGERKAKREDAKKMLEEGIEIDVIVRITGLKKEQIEKMQARRTQKNNC